MSSQTRKHAQTKDIEAFKPIHWAAPYLSSKDWTVYGRTRGAISGSPSSPLDRFCESTLRANDGVQVWLEAYQAPAAGSRDVLKSISLVKFGHGLHGLSGICHGGAMLALLDEGVGFTMVANLIEDVGYEAAEAKYGAGRDLGKVLASGGSMQEVLKGQLVTAKMDVRFLRPVPCPGMVGVEVDVMEKKENRIVVRAVMRDAEGVGLMRTESVFVRIGGSAKL